VLCNASGSRVLAQALDPLIRKVLLITAGSRYGRVCGSFEEHKEILSALRQRDLDLVLRRLKTHLTTSLRLNLEMWERR
jgi:DNA-binding GntR family transcriptional regulator